MSKKISEKKMFKTSVEVTLSSGEQMIINKLKAGKFYIAQKIYSEWFSVILDILSKNDEISLSGLTDNEGKADADKIQKLLKNNKQTNELKLIKEIYTKNDEISNKKLELVSICLDIDKEKIEEEYYQEDVELMLNTIIELNAFEENLKNSVAPMANLGANK